jgi:hypothetical protein
MSVHIRRLIIAAFCLALVGTVPVQRLSADGMEKTIVMSIDQRTEIPGYLMVDDESGRDIILYETHLLQPGLYLLEAVAQSSTRVVVRVTSLDRKRTYATLLAVSDFKLAAPEMPEVTFHKAGVGHPPALHAWLDPDFGHGIEFVYPKMQAINIAQISEGHVMATTMPAARFGPILRPTVKELLAAPLVVIEPGGREVGK